MDAPAADSQLNRNDFATWLARNRATGRVTRYATLGVAAVLVATLAFSVWVLTGSAQPGSLLSPPLIAVLLVANLIPAIALMVLYSRHVARKRAARLRGSSIIAPRFPGTLGGVPSGGGATTTGTAALMSTVRRGSSWPGRTRSDRLNRP